MKKEPLIIVTGGAGFIGSHVIHELNSQGHSHILIFDNLGHTEKWKNLIGKKFMDILPKEACLDWLKGKEDSIEAIIHLGACTSTVETDAHYLLENNYRFSCRLAEYALSHQKRFIYASSAATYGDGKEGFSDEESKLERFHPLNMYGMSKHLFDLWLKNQGLLKEVTGLKYFNVFGPHEGHKGRMASVIFHMTPAILKDKKVRLFKSSEPDKYADGEQMRDFIYVRDVARMTCAFLKTHSTGIFNIGTGNPATWKTLVSYIFDTLKIPTQIEFIDMPLDLAGKYQNYSAADMRKTQAALGNAAQTTPLNEAVQEYVEQLIKK
jgi:ADP-L-glycero-D-manno-heptose 6-epimerase